MNEGKPTKAKWWSRPRPSAPDDAPQGSGPAGPSGPPEAQDGPTTPDTLVAPDIHTSNAPEAPDASGDYIVAPARPTSVASGTQASGTDASGTDESGTGEPGTSKTATGAATAPEPAVSSQSADAAESTGATDATGSTALVGPPAPPAPSAPTDAHEAAGARDVPDNPAAAAGTPAAPAERPRPVHDPDPYSTPPYGEPGPWAPAPPVQHPGATPAQGTTLPPQLTTTTSHGAPVPGPAPSYDTGVPVGAAPAAPAPYATVPPQAPAGHAPAGHASTGHTPTGHAPTGPMPTGHLSTGQAPTGHAPAAPPQPPGPQQFVDPGAAQPAQFPDPGAPQPAPAIPYAPGATPGFADPQAAGVPEEQDVMSGGRWPAYDPWAAPLHQTGAAPRDPKRGRRSAVLVLTIVALVAGLIGGALGSYLERTGDSDITLPQAGAESKDRAPGSVAGIAASALPSVVTIHVRGDTEAGTGTGFVLDGKGHILTNNHVIQPAGSHGEISVTFSGGQTAKASVVGHDSGYDLAVIKVSGVSGLKPLPLGNSDNVQVGDPVVAIGAPFDLANTVTSGIISAKERPITTAGSEDSDGSDVSYVDALQTDAPINPGNSGGPLVDSKARVIGINSAIRSADSGESSEGGQAGSIGLGFAIPVNQAKRVAEELINTGSATHPVIGVTLDMDYSGDGARVADQGNSGGPAVTEGGPADQAGIRAGDVVTQVDGVPVHSAEELIVRIRAHRPGDKLELTLRHDATGDGGDTAGGGSTHEVTLVLGTEKGD